MRTSIDSSHCPGSAARTRRLPFSSFFTEPAGAVYPIELLATFTPAISGLKRSIEIPFSAEQMRRAPNSVHRKHTTIHRAR